MSDRPWARCFNQYPVMQMPPMMKFNRREEIRVPASQSHTVRQLKRFEAVEQKRKTVDEHTDSWQQNP